MQVLRLEAVKQTGGGSQSAIVEATGIDRSSIAALVLRLVKKGWLQRRRTHSDRRAYAVRLTSTGVTVLAAAEPAAKQTQDILLAPLSSSERSRFLKVLERITADPHRERV